jgi:phage terminase large subunit-like protein
MEHIAIIGQTKGDVRDTMVEQGDSSIMKVSDPWFMPEYQPSKRRLVWPNGSVATIYSGDEPDQLRGPQHHRAWVDELCFAAGTLITTEHGDVPIEQVKPGVRVRTRTGWKRVVNSGMTSSSEKVFRLETNEGRELIGTANHPVWVDGLGFIPLLHVKSCDILTVWDKRNSQSSFVGAGKSGTTKRTTITTEPAGCYTAPFTHRYTGKSRPVWISTTSTATRPTTISAIWKRLTALPILGAIGRRAGEWGRNESAPKAERLIGRLGLGSHSLLLAPFAEMNSWARVSGQSIAPALVGKRQSGVIQNTEWIAPANSVAELIRRLNISPASFVPAHALPSGLTQTAEATNESKRRAPFASSHFTRPIRARSVVRGLADTFLNHSGRNKTDAVKSVVELETPIPVFNLEVEDDHEYFANGILVHNSKFRYPQETWDMLEMGLRLGTSPQVVVTSTPRPIPVIKRLLADPQTAVTTGSTYENKDNLSSRFIQRVIDRYEGTRLGQQELYGQILDDDPRALWNRDTLETSRVTSFPDLFRIVVAVDPHATSGQTGIVVVGASWAGEQLHVYVLDDATPEEGAKPELWGRSAISAYNKWHADTLVAEINNGGDMVENVIRTIPGGQQVRYETVRATRGKYTRAEPVSALWEQGRGHMVGYYADLEDQLCTYVPGENDSPDRLDAMVWGATLLMGGDGWLAW